MVLLGNRIRLAREQAGLTQEELAGLIGTSRTAIARYESGEIEPKIRNLISLAEHLDVSSDYLLGIDHSGKSDALNLSDEAIALLQIFIKEVRKH